MSRSSEPTNVDAVTAGEGRPAVVLLSGGLDSATTLAIARAEGYACHALSFDYGQRHRVELDAARAVADHLGVAGHRWVTIDLRAFGGSALTDDIAVPKSGSAGSAGSAGSDAAGPAPRPGLLGGGGLSSAGSECAGADGHRAIPVTYVPARNTIFLSYALALAEVLGAGDVFLGVNAVDYSGYPDCRPEYVRAFERMANLATRAGVEATRRGGRWLRIHAPLIRWSKAEIIRRGLELGVDYGRTHSCYDPQPEAATGRWRACGRCDACVIRRRAFAELGVQDPVRPMG